MSPNFSRCATSKIPRSSSKLPCVVLLMSNWFGFARPSGRTAIASAPQINFAPLSPNRCQRRRTASVARPSVVPSHPSIGCSAIRLPIVLPLIVIPAKAPPIGEALVMIASSHGISTPNESTCARKASGVFSVGMRVSLKGEVIRSRCWQHMNATKLSF